MLGSLGSGFLGSAFRPRRALRSFAEMSPLGRAGLLGGIYGLFGSRRPKADLFTPIARAHAQRLTNRRSKMRKAKASARADRASAARDQKRARDRRAQMARK